MKYFVLTKSGKLLVETDFLDVARKIIQANHGSYIQFSSEAIEEVNEGIEAERVLTKVLAKSPFVVRLPKFGSINVSAKISTKLFIDLLRFPANYKKTFGWALIKIIQGPHFYIDELVDSLGEAA